ncbi:uncharacterized protein LOC133298657 [Gastrolobium bilobum]|uniref:uncharacterized protein LOC133298657 n=1 Tax=Gastrolobium bilobum TaxID=150636 RepID=UPI002AB04E53|nr:uncharacterized protein LOC133298657 [Gastrolobium bilobum]
MASERVSSETVAKAVDSLLKWRNSQSETQKPKLFDEDEEFVYLILTLKKIPQKGRVNPYKIPLPHSLLSPFSEQCLIIDDRPKAQLTKAQAQNKIQSGSIPISKVLKLTKLASDYRPFEAKRKLCNSYDLFFADKRVVPLLPRLLGKQFFKKKKVPVALDLKKSNWKEQVQKACSSGLLSLSTGTCSVVRVAKLSMERDDIVSNVVAAIDGITEVVPIKWSNVRSFHVKLLESLALPVYQTVPDVKLKIVGIKENERKEKEEEEEEEEAGEEKVGKKKGRIHQVKYMDDKVGEDLIKDDDDDDDVVVEEDSENDEKGNGELVNKKRKKGVKVMKGVLNELTSVKRLKKSAKEGGKQKKESLMKKIEDKLSIDDLESGNKKKNKKRVDVEVKAKRSKRVL